MVLCTFVLHVDSSHEKEGIITCIYICLVRTCVYCHVYIPIVHVHVYNTYCCLIGIVTVH